MTRFAALAAALLTLAAGHALAQPRIVWLSPDGGQYSAPGFESLRDRLRALGWIEGRNVVLEERWAMGSDEKLEQLAREAVRSKPDVLVTQTKAVFSARQAGAAMPVVFGFSGDPVVGKLVGSLARPGGNMTGMSLMSLELVGKRMEVLKELVPQLKRVGVLANPGHPGERAEFEASSAAAKALGLQIDYFAVKNPQDLEAALAGVAKAKDEALVLFPDNGTIRYSERIAKFAAQARIPAISGWSEFADRGNVVTYGPNLREAYGHLAEYVDKILRGAKPADLPVELPTRVEMVVNLRAARAIGLNVPQALRLRADRVIE